jgi:hypothetical protein
VERSRLVLRGIEDKLATGDEASPPRHVEDKARLITMQQNAQGELKRYEDVLSIATTVLGERRP